MLPVERIKEIARPEHYTVCFCDVSLEIMRITLQQMKENKIMEWIEWK